MRSIFLCENPATLKGVYTEEQMARLVATANADATVYRRADLLASPASFHDVDYVFSTWGMPDLTEEEIAVCLPSLQCVFYGAGSVQSFARPFLSRGVRVFSAWAANAVPVAEYAVAQIILAGKGFYAHTALMRERNLAACNRLKKAYVGNYGERVGLIGAGMIGSMVAERLQSYALEVCVFDPFLAPERAAALHVKPVSLEELFATCRVVSNHLANNAQTRGMLNYDLFSRMLPYSTFINTGRGAQVVEDDLVRVLREREDITALLDVTDPEPPLEGHPFYTLPNCHLTPHIAGSLNAETHRMAEYMIEEFDHVALGCPTHFEVTLHMLETMA
ncbi:MAG: hydroxyacid dehydrogenase [Clostridia bacterium]|nr:hydroxyacid dehydrogenase [Clostridia bacterium]